MCPKNVGLSCGCQRDGFHAFFKEKTQENSFRKTTTENIRCFKFPDSTLFCLARFFVPLGLKPRYRA